MNQPIDPENPEIVSLQEETRMESSRQDDPLQADPLQDPDVEQLAATGDDEYERPTEGGSDEVSIDDALEADRVAADGPDSRNADGFGFDEDRERGTDETVAAEQGNRDEDRMESDVEDEELDQIAGSDGDAAGTDRDLADPEA